MDGGCPLRGSGRKDAVKEYGGISVAVDVVLFRRGDPPQVLLIQRGRPPFMGRWALPGGFVEVDEDLLAAAERELAEETGLSGVELTQLGAFGAVDRDPRRRVISIAYWGVIDEERDVVAGDDAARAAWHPLTDLPPLAFDHGEILGLARQRAGL
ncbi:MAG: NUDIX hydrolase [Firmicutes bacterium]|nr:NUDIX hydrolase [Bacillota bacterium]